jgi:hypothetical protein
MAFPIPWPPPVTTATFRWMERFIFEEKLRWQKGGASLE